MFGDDSTIAIIIGVLVAIVVIAVGQWFSRKPSAAAKGDPLTGNDLAGPLGGPLDPLPEIPRSSSALRQLFVPVVLVVGLGALVVFVIIPNGKMLLEARASNQLTKKLTDTHESIQAKIGQPLNLPNQSSPFNGKGIEPVVITMPPAPKIQTTGPIITPPRPVGPIRR